VTTWADWAVFMVAVSYIILLPKAIDAWRTVLLGEGPDDEFGLLQMSLKSIENDGWRGMLFALAMTLHSCLGLLFAYGLLIIAIFIVAGTLAWATAMVWTFGI